MATTGVAEIDSETVHRDLRDGVPVWLANTTSRASFGRCRANLKCDVVIVGGGISGALTAEALTERGLDVVVIDRRDPGLGSTAASTALLQFEIDTPLTILSDEIGGGPAAQAWQRSLRAVADLSTRTRTLGIASHFHDRRAIYLPGNVLDAAGLAREVKLRRSIGMPSKLIDGLELQQLTGIERNCAVLSDGAAEADPFALAQGYLGAMCKRGGKLFAHETVTEYFAEARELIVGLESGHEIACKSIVFATGYEMLKGVPMEGHQIITTWSFATRAQPDLIWPGRELIWEAADPYLYIRTTDDGRVIVGGEDEEFDDDEKRLALLPDKVATLSRKLGELIPGIDVEPDFLWTGSFGESETGLPTIGQVPGQPNVYAILGYGGNGITFSMMASQILAAAITGGADPDAALFAFK